MIVSKPLHLHCCLLRRYSTFTRFGGNAWTGWKKKTLRLGSVLLAGGFFFCGYHALAPGLRVCECDELPDYRVAIRKSRDLLRRVKVKYKVCKSDSLSKLNNCIYHLVK